MVRRVSGSYVILSHIPGGLPTDSGQVPGSGADLVDLTFWAALRSFLPGVRIFDVDLRSEGWSLQIFTSSYRACRAGSRQSTCKWLSGVTIGHLSASTRVLYMWAGSAGRMAPVFLSDCSLSPRAVWASYALKRMYSMGSAPVHPGCQSHTSYSDTISITKRLLFGSGVVTVFFWFSFRKFTEISSPSDYLKRRWCSFLLVRDGVGSPV